MRNAMTQKSFWQSFRNDGYSLKCFLKLSYLRSTDKVNSDENEGISLLGLKSLLFSTLCPSAASNIPCIEVFW